MFMCTSSMDEALKSLKTATRLYPDFTVRILDMQDMDDRIRAVDIDPDLADFHGYCVSIEVPEKIY